MNQIEREVVILNSAWEMIDGLVNWAMFVRHAETEPTNMMFETSVHRRLFIILLGDFLSEVRAFKGEPIPLGLLSAPSNARPSDLTFLFHLRQVAADPALGPEARILLMIIDEFSTWLEGEFVAPGVNLHNVDIVADIQVSRLRYLKMCGDIAKHNLARLATNVKHLQRLLAKAGHDVTEETAFLAVENFFDWFHDDIFIYHSSHIAEFLNNIRLAIYDYLKPEFSRSHHLTGQVLAGADMYGYRVPEAIQQPIASAMYWELMNRCRSTPWVHRFQVSQSFKSQY
ncbi:hypothetical protein HX900_20340 [Rhizobium sp. WYCCWR 11290]|uniref:Uncharacterized protein n=1 Tax=Rhizobium changzhiense TaxID=2692317 RepID=A0A7Z0RNM2_9HYPH|nr:hypothetical protein [Rhizobium changzhiense]NZD63445.1 hypothetical protein [Rhizobium changzhiense]